MNQLELVKRAKGYIDALANGIDPFSGRELPNDAVLNQPHMIRCFFYVSDILRQVMENGGQVGGKKVFGRKAPFTLSLEQRRSVPFSETPLPISKFTDRLNGMIDLDAMKRLPATAVTDWLVEKGFLAVTERPDSRRAKLPTPQGEGIGLSVETRQGAGGPYTVVLYNEAAQHFVIDNLDDILHM